MSSQIIAVCNADVNDISFLNVFTQDSTLFNDGFTFQKLPFPSHVITVIRKLLSYILVTPVADPGGSLGQLTPKRLWRSVKTARLRYKCAPFLVLKRSRNSNLNKQCFTLCWTSRFTCRTLTKFLIDWHQQCYSVVTMLLSRVRTAKQLQTRSLSLAHFWTCRWAM